MADDLTTNRTEKLNELAEHFQNIRRAIAFKSGMSAKHPAITPAQWIALNSIVQLKEATVKDIARLMGASSSAASQLIDGLVAAGCVVRKESANDRRSVTLRLSPKTTRQIEAMRKVFVSKIAQRFSVLSDSEFDSYCALTAKVAAANA